MIAHTSDDREVYFRTEGTGQELLLVHGGSPDHFETLVDLLSARHKCVTFDRLGFGRSARLELSAKARATPLGMVRTRRTRDGK